MASSRLQTASRFENRSSRSMSRTAGLSGLPLVVR